MLLRKILTRSFSTAVNPLKTVVRFENQDVSWTWKQLEHHSNAFAYGLSELGFVKGSPNPIKKYR
jgi:acyl-CoA synthetase (AMP-forming)/AMP-acid ligase II